MSFRKLFIPLAIIFVIICVWYFFNDPTNTIFSLPCPWRLLTGTQCPGCGIQRALHALLHGDVLGALAYNYFFIISIPFATLVVVAELFPQRLHNLYMFVRHRYVLRTYIVLFFVWWILRNILDI